MKVNHSKDVILASSSTYRRQQLTQLALTFTYESPDIDETPLAGEAPQATAARLAAAKASKVLASHPSAIIIGSDQVAQLHQRQLGKPKTPEKAREQLTACSGNNVIFYTAVCVRSAELSLTEVITTEVRFLPLSPTTIEDYVERESPLDCAGSFKCEGLGIALFESIESKDPTALVGLPLIAVSRMLARHGIHVLGQHQHGAS